MSLKQKRRRRKKKKSRTVNQAMVQLLWGGDPTPVGEVEVGEGWLQCTPPRVTDVSREAMIGIL